ncbi:hypothetical protein H5V45_02275 [Nocardioides sp. KIGAM211]|uniref:Hemolysin-type calcium-binding repeat-containing protein n=1 Tax=Nocardioides luti TaxID=2761101 RepID=A0A7X0RD66_9ACTN|nr:calcium-binding protein [Nocardioides luti]MBB6626137.1 hypothetical protein [Nocardioides luti]
MSRPAVRVSAAGALLLALAPALVVPLSSAGARLGAPTCQGEPATVVGEPGSDVVRGTDGPDVIVSRGVPEVRAAGGADRVCVTKGPGPASDPAADETRTVYAGMGNDDVTVEAGATAYVVVVLGEGADTFTGAGEPDDVWAGDRNDARRTGPEDAVDAEADTITTGGGRDQVFVGQPDVPLRDVVDTGGSGDRVVVEATAANAVSSLVLGTGRDVLEWEWPDGVGGEWLVDATAGVAKRDGGREFTFSGVDDYRLPVPGRASLTFRGSDAKETVWASSYARVDLGGGNDRFHVRPTFTLPDAGAGVLDGGAGTDRLVVADDQAYAVRLGDAMTFDDPAVADATLSGIEDVDAYSGRGRARVIGGDGANRLWTYGCRIILAGGNGDDRLVAVGDCGEEPGPKLRGGAGDDRVLGGDADDELLGGAGDDRLDGGPGRDSADGGAGSDRCVAEVRTRC